MGSDQPVLFLDLHGVLVDTPKIFEEYKRLTVKHLRMYFDLNYNEASARYDRAMTEWQTRVFGYLKNPSKQKTGKPLVKFLEEEDQLFSEVLYEGLSHPANCELRTRPFEYKIAKKIKSLYPEVLETLDALKMQNYRMYIASSSHSSHIKGLIQANKLNKYVDGAFGYDDLAATKYSVSYYQKLLDETGSKSEYSFMIGNSIQEIIKPRKIGMRTIHIYRERDVPHDIRQLADRSLNNLEALAIHLDKIPIPV